MDSAGATVDPKVYIGTWVNWSRGPVLGSTLTLTKQNGNLLIAFTAFFIGFISSRAWRIISFTLHRFYSTPDKSRDALYHQRQAILRNSETPGWSFWTLCQVSWAWRGSQSQSWRSHPLVVVLPALLWSTLCIVSFAIASGFSAQISTGVGNEALIDGSNCGLVAPAPPDPSKPLSDTDLLVAKDSARRRSDAVNYAQQCYDSPLLSRSTETNAVGVFDCNSFVIPSLTGTIDPNAPCPFADGICRSDSNLLLDTGYIDSHEQLGSNAPAEERILMRQRYHCAPLRTDGFTSNVTVNGRNFTRYHYGGFMNFDRSSDAVQQNGFLNYTLDAPSLDSQYERGRNPQAGALQLSVFYASAVNRTIDPVFSEFLPIPSLERPDGNLGLVFLSGNGVMFAQPGKDDWYRTTVPNPERLFQDPDRRNGSLPAYMPEEAASPLACVEQYQFCKPGTSESSTEADQGHQCGGAFGSFNDAVGEAAVLFNTTIDEINLAMAPNSSTGSRFMWFVNTIGALAGSALEIPSHPSSKRLLSEQLIMSGVQFGLDTDQWKHDVTHWWSTWRALVQVSFAEMANGPRDPSFASAGAVIPPGNQDQKHMCYNQKVQSHKHTSFSMFGLCFIYVTGTLIFILSYTLEPLTRRLTRRSHKNLEWTSTDALHLQSLSFQGRGQGSWSRFDHSVPITKNREILEPLMSMTPGRSDSTDVERTETSEVKGSKTPPSPPQSHLGPTCHPPRDIEEAMTETRGTTEIASESSASINIEDESRSVPLEPHLTGGTLTATLTRPYSESVGSVCNNFPSPVISEASPVVPAANRSEPHATPRYPYACPGNLEPRSSVR